MRSPHTVTGRQCNNNESVINEVLLENKFVAWMDDLWPMKRVCLCNMHVINAKCIKCTLIELTFSLAYVCMCSAPADNPTNYMLCVRLSAPHYTVNVTLSNDNLGCCKYTRTHMHMHNHTSILLHFF